MYSRTHSTAAPVSQKEAIHQEEKAGLKSERGRNGENYECWVGPKLINVSLSKPLNIIPSISVFPRSSDQTHFHSLHMSASTSLHLYQHPGHGRAKCRDAVLSPFFWQRGELTELIKRENKSQSTENRQKIWVKVQKHKAICWVCWNCTEWKAIQ